MSTPINRSRVVVARHELLNAAADVLSAERHIDGDPASMARLTRAENAMDKAALDLAMALRQQGRVA